MLLNESMKSSNTSQLNQNENTLQNSASSAIGVTSATTTGTSTTTGTPLRSRNNNRDRQQSDEKWDKQDNSNFKGKNPPKPPEEFYKDLQSFHEKRSTSIMHTPKITGREVDLHRLYCEVTERGGFQKVNMKDEWDEILPELGLNEKIINGSAALKYIYRRILEKYERLNYFGEDPDKVDAMEAADMAEFNMSGGRGRGSRYPSSYGSSNSAIIHNVAMSYNYRQHNVNMDRRRQFKLSTDLHKASPYEKLMLSLLSPLPNEQDFAINACTLMANESKHTLKLNEYPKLLDALLAHTGVFSDYTMRKLFQHIYSSVRHHSLYGFWYDLLSDSPQILDLYTDEQALRDAALIDDYDDDKPEMEGIWEDCKELDFLNLRTGLGTQDYVGQRVLQVISIFRNLSFLDENLNVLVKNKTFLRFLVMSANIRWSNIHIQALEITGNIAGELEILDPAIDELSRCLMATLCDGIEGPDRGVIINCLEILYKLCQRDKNDEQILSCLNMSFYNTIAMFLSLNDIMLLLFTLEAIYALTCLGTKSCSSMMQVKGIIDQLISLISVEAQSYGPDGCILMRVVETVPGNMLPMVAQNIANLQNVAVIQKQPQALNQMITTQIKPQIILPNPMQATTDVNDTPAEQNPQQIQMPQNFTHDDEQYALAWLGATFEKTTSLESHIETQELYRMYLSHCQKSGKHSVVNHLHFPKLVRLIYTSTVGPAAVRKADGTDLPGLHYVSIRLRAQPLPLQPKITGQTSVTGKQTENNTSARKTKRKAKLQVETNQGNVTMESTPDNLPTMAKETKPEITNTNNPITALSEEAEKISTPPPPLPPPQPVETKCEEKMEVDDLEETIKTETSLIQTTESLQTSEPNQTTQAIQTITATAGPMGSSTSLIKSLLANKVNQRQQKQNILINPSLTTTSSTNTNTTTTSTQMVNTTETQPIKVASTAITSMVNTSLMQHTAVKVGQTTIKPLNAHSSVEKKTLTQISESTPPPLAPLSGANVAKDASGRPIILANQMLVDILDKKMIDPPIPGIITKRKIDEHLVNNKRLAIDSSTTTGPTTTTTKEEAQVTPSKNAANLYAEMAASILEDEDLEEFSTQQTETQPLTTQPAIIIPTKPIQQQQQPTTAPPMQNVQRQLVFQTNQSPHIKQTTQIPNAVATIKTDQGLQTLPVILQQKPMEVQQQQMLQQIIQPQQQQQTQYVLATNQQGQTYLVAQQTQAQPTPTPQQQPTQTVLVTQTPQQQTTGQKTIIILQQQTMPGQQQIITGPGGQGQKMIMTTAQGQQVLVTQRPQTPQQIFINPQTGQATHIQHMPVQNQQNRQIIQTTAQQQQQQIQAGQISPSLLNQLNQIPATVKLHQPIAQQQTQQAQAATINRMGQKIAIVQGTAQQQQQQQPPPPIPTAITPATPVVIPQLQQHQSIIQQHIISGPAEKRHVIMGGGGRAIEIKETVITQAQPPPQQCQLNSQTIITTQQQPNNRGSTTTPPLLQQQQQQQQAQQQLPDPTPSLIQAKSQTANPPILANVKKPPILIKPSLATVKLATLANSGPPPLAVVNNVTNTNATVANQTTQNPTQTNDSLKDFNKKEDLNKTASTPTTAATVQNPIQSNRPLGNITTAAGSAQATPTLTTTSSTSSNTATTTQQTSTSQQQQSQSLQLQPQTIVTPPQAQLPPIDVQWLYICDWRNCPRKKFKSVSDLQHHVCTSHAPDHLDQSAEIFCQWGVGPGLCDGVPRKRFSLMTHLIDRHLTLESLRAAVQRRIATGMHNIAPTKPPVTIVRNIELSQRANNASPAPSTSSSSSSQTPATGSSALQAIKRHTADFMNSKELMDENEGPVTKSIRLTASLILRNLVTYTNTAKRSIRRFEPHLANIALSNVESSGTISHILYELNN